MKRFLLSLILLLPLFEAHATTHLTVCNRSKVDLNVITVENHNSILSQAMGATGWTADGWKVIGTGDCKLIFTTDNNSSAYFSLSFGQGGKVYSYEGQPKERRGWQGFTAAYLSRTDVFAVCAKQDSFRLVRKTREALAQCGPGDFEVAVGLKFTAANDNSAEDVAYDVAADTSNSVVTGGTSRLELKPAPPKVTQPSQPSSRPSTLREQAFATIDSQHLLDAAVSDAARSWKAFMYVPGSTRKVAVTKQNPDGTPAEISGTYNATWSKDVGGMEGTVRLTFADGIPSCLYFWDSPTTCKPISTDVLENWNRGLYGTRR